MVPWWHPVSVQLVTVALRVAVGVLPGLPAVVDRYTAYPPSKDVPAVDADQLSLMSVTDDVAVRPPGTDGGDGCSSVSLTSEDFAE
jgi:hypothetical protein